MYLAGNSSKVFDEVRLLGQHRATDPQYATSVSAFREWTAYALQTRMQFGDTIMEIASEEFNDPTWQETTIVGTNQKQGGPSRGKKSVPDPAFPKKLAGTPCAQPCLVAVGGWRLAAVGGWQLATGGWWRLVVAGGWWRLVFGGWWRLAADGSCRLAVGGPLGWALRVVGCKKKNGSLKDRSDQKTHHALNEFMLLRFAIAQGLPILASWLPLVDNYEKRFQHNSNFIYDTGKDKPANFP